MSTKFGSVETAFWLIYGTARVFKSSGISSKLGKKQLIWRNIDIKFESKLPNIPEPRRLGQILENLANSSMSAGFFVFVSSYFVRRVSSCFAFAETRWSAWSSSLRIIRSFSQQKVVSSMKWMKRRSQSSDSLNTFKKVLKSCIRRNSLRPRKAFYVPRFLLHSVCRLPDERQRFQRILENLGERSSSLRKNFLLIVSRAFASFVYLRLAESDILNQKDPVLWTSALNSYSRNMRYMRHPRSSNCATFSHPGPISSRIP